MADYTIKTVDEVGFYEGPHAIPGIRFRHAGRDLGVSAWGMNVIEIAAGCDRYPEHDHEKDAQEEVYVVLRGSATLHMGSHVSGTERALATGAMVRVGASTVRKLVPGPEGVTLLALGGTPGKAYEPRR